MASPTETGHPGDEALLAVAHRPSPAGAASAADMGAGVVRHIDGCDRCRRRVEELRREEQGIAALLAALDHPMPPRPLLADAAAPAPRREVRRGVLAAGLALLATVGVAAALPSTAIHRWLRERLAPAVHEPARESAPAPSAGQAAGISVAATPSLMVAFRRAEAGVLEIAFVPEGDVVVRSSGGRVGYEVGDGRVIVDDRRPAARYEILVPAAVQRLTVMAEDRVVFESDHGRVAPGRSMVGPDRYRVPLTSRGAP